MTHGFDPSVSRWSPLPRSGVRDPGVHQPGGLGLGADWRDIRMSFQEYFERLRDVPGALGQAPMAALLGAYWMQTEMGLGRHRGQGQHVGVLR